MGENGRGLRAALGANAIFSGICGLGLLLAPGSLAAWIGLPLSWPLAVLGAGLLAFAALVAWTAADAASRRAFALGIVAADALWVAASPAAMLAGAGVLSATGHALVGVVAVVVAGLAAMQWRGLRDLDRPQDTARRT